VVYGIGGHGDAVRVRDRGWICIDNILYSHVSGESDQHWSEKLEKTAIDLLGYVCRDSHSTYGMKHVNRVTHRHTPTHTVTHGHQMYISR